jgi:hypothetical protein
MTDLVQDTPVERRKVHILMSIAEPDICGSIASTIHKGLGNKFDVSIVEYARVDQLLSHAENSPVDLFILLLNNMQFIDPPPFRETRRWLPLEVVSHVRETYGKPVIALSGSSRVEAEEAKQAGANFFFWLPVDWRPFIDAVAQCLKQVGSVS